MAKKKAVRVQQVNLADVYVRPNGDRVETYNATILVRGKYFNNVTFQAVSHNGRTIHYSCFKSHLELYGVMIAYFSRQLTKEQDRNKKHNQATADISRAIAEHLQLAGGHNLYEELIE